nr:hypothetical protein [Paenibacillus sp. yr247]
MLPLLPRFRLAGDGGVTFRFGEYRRRELAARIAINAGGRDVQRSGGVRIQSVMRAHAISLHFGLK